MSRLERLLSKHGVSPGVARKVRKAAKEYIREGLPAREAQIAAVRDHMDELRDRQEEILGMEEEDDRD